VPAWTAADVPSLEGRVALVTGPTSGIGREVTRVLARRGAHVLLACRDVAAGEALAAELRGGRGPARGRADVVPLDLADLRRVEQAAARTRDLVDALDVVVLNAGVMGVPQRRTTAQGFELQLGVNHLGHVALVAHLLPLVLRRPPARVVTVTSASHRLVGLDVDDLRASGRYRPWVAYARSKLANVLFALELDRRARAAGRDLVSVAAHPGVTRTRLGRRGPLQGLPGPVGVVVAAGSRVVGQSARRGALPLLYAATAPGVAGGACYGPGGPFELVGGPVAVTPSARALDEELAARVWRWSEEAVGVTFSLTPRWGGVAGEP